MARGDTQPPPRRGHFDEDGGPVQAAPKRISYPCWADECPMPGTIFLDGVRGICAWHYGRVGDDIPKVTRAILNWDCVQREINAGRRVLTAPDTLANPKALDAALRDAWERMKPAVLDSGWKPRLEPRQGERYGEWVRRIERFLSNRIKESLKPGLVITDDDAPTPTVADMLSRVRGAAPKGDWA